MPKDAPEIRTSASGSDASYSRKYMTRNNYNGPTLLRSIGKRKDNHSPTNILQPHRSTITMPSSIDTDIYAAPLSSDEEREPSEDDDSASSPASTKRKRNEEDSLLVPNKRTKQGQKPMRSSQRKQAYSASTKSSLPTSSAQEAVPEWMNMSQERISQSSQGKRSNNKTYSKGAASQVASQAEPKKGKGLVVPDDLPPSPKTPQRPKKIFQTLPYSPASARRTSPQKIILKPPSELAEPVRPALLFSIPDEPQALVSPSTSTFNTDKSPKFDMNDYPDSAAKTRRSSTSSLSSVDSLIDYEFSQQEKDDLANGRTPLPPPPAGYIRCPQCSQPVKHPIAKHSTDPTKLSSRRQAQFCQRHKVQDAEKAWQARGYPSIDWTVLEKERIPAHMPQLRKILFRQTSSYYFETLESKIKAAKGQARKIKNYLLEGVIDIAKQGYYGPKGAKIMAHAITESLAKQLRIQLKADKTIATAGVSGFVSAVLLPELCQALVMEDLKIDDENRAREVMSESSDVGLLLCPDDDHVERVEEDDS